MRAARLGDDIDDFCVKCKRIMNHSVVSILNDEPAKVRCRTCYSDHDFRHEQAPPPKIDPRKAALFNQVLANTPGTVVVPEIEDEETDTTQIEDDTDILAEYEAVAEVEAKPKPAGRKKAKG